MGGIIIFVLIFIAIIIGAVFIVKKKLKEIDSEDMENVAFDSSNPTTAQEFLPFRDIKNGVVDLGNHEYIAYLEVSSINYNLKTSNERAMIEQSFQRFLNGLTFPIAFALQTKTRDNTKFLNNMKKELQENIKKFPQLKTYAEEYYHEMTYLGDTLGSNRQKRKYVIIPFDDVSSLKDLNDEEKRKYALEELGTRIGMIMDGLAGVGLKASLLSYSEAVKLIYSTFYRNGHTDSENLSNGDYESLFVEGEGKLSVTQKEGVLDWILYEAGIRIQNEIMTNDTFELTKQDANKIIEEIQKLRDNYAGFYDAMKLHSKGININKDEKSNQTTKKKKMNTNDLNFEKKEKSSKEKVSHSIFEEDDLI